MRDSAWDEAKQQRLDALRACEEAGVLTPTEQAELDGLLTLLDDLAWQQLQPALKRMEQEQVATVAAIARLEATRDDLTEVARPPTPTAYACPGTTPRTPGRPSCPPG